MFLTYILRNSSRIQMSRLTVLTCDHDLNDFLWFIWCFVKLFADWIHKMEKENRRFSLPVSLPQRQRRMSVRSFYWVMVNPLVNFYVWFSMFHCVFERNKSHTVTLQAALFYVLCRFKCFLYGIIGFCSVCFRIFKITEKEVIAIRWF